MKWAGAPAKENKIVMGGFIVRKKIVKIAMVLLIITVVGFTLANITAVKSEAFFALKGALRGGICIEPGECPQ